MDVMISRRKLLSLAAAAAPLVRLKAARKQMPIGIQLYSVRGELRKDLNATVTAVAKMGFDGVEFYAPYFEWDAARAKEVRTLLDGLGLKCFSTHNSAKAFEAASLPKAIELNHILGSQSVVMAHPGKVEGGESGWKKVAENLNKASDILKPAKLSAGYHNHNPEFRPIDGGKSPIAILTANTVKAVKLQLDVANCLDSGGDPVAFLRQNAGRVESLHVKDWTSEGGKAYRVILGDGIGKWGAIFDAAESVGGARYYLIEQEECDHPQMEAAKLSLDAFRKLHGA